MGGAKQAAHIKANQLVLLTCLLLETDFGAPLQMGQDSPSDSKFLTLQTAVLFSLVRGEGEGNWTENILSL